MIIKYNPIYDNKVQSQNMIIEYCLRYVLEKKVLI